MRNMKEVKYLVIHCSATKLSKLMTADDVDNCHRAQGWDMIGYHWYIDRNGLITEGRKEQFEGAHVRGYNDCAIGICYEGGLDEEGNYADTRTPEQCDTLFDLLITLKQQFPKARIYGHYEFNSTKHCPCFDVDEYRVIFNE